ncbi:MAG: hypothetical protein V4475_10605 [Pseudomonadota bacterium]
MHDNVPVLRGCVLQFLIILVTAIVTAAAAQIFVVIKDLYLASREGKFSALYAALFFEQYGDHCSQRFGEKEAYDVPDRRVDADHSAMPKLADFLKEIAWHTVTLRN